MPLLGGAIANGLCIRFNWLTFLVHPLDFRLTYRKRRLFGENKTLRGLIIFSFGTALLFSLQAVVLHKVPDFRSLEILNYSQVSPPFMGFLMGMAAMLSELPNSFFKRQLGISPGTAGSGIWLPIFYVVDQIDVLAGLWLVLSFVMPITLSHILISIVFIFITHQVITVIGYVLGMRHTLR